MWTQWRHAHELELTVQKLIRENVSLQAYVKDLEAALAATNRKLNPRAKAFETAAVLLPTFYPFPGLLDSAPIPWLPRYLWIKISVPSGYHLPKCPPLPSSIPLCPFSSKIPLPSGPGGVLLLLKLPESCDPPVSLLPSSLLSCNPPEVKEKRHACKAFRNNNRKQYNKDNLIGFSKMPKPLWRFDAAELKKKEDDEGNDNDQCLFLLRANHVGTTLQVDFHETHRKRELVLVDSVLKRQKEAKDQQITYPQPLAGFQTIEEIEKVLKDCKRYTAARHPAGLSFRQAFLELYRLHMSRPEEEERHYAVTLYNPHTCKTMAFFRLVDLPSLYACVKGNNPTARNLAVEYCAAKAIHMMTFSYTGNNSFVAYQSLTPPLPSRTIYRLFFV